VHGPVMQLGFVVPDLEAAANHWVKLGVGPFFLLEHISFGECFYKGNPTHIDMSVAVGQWGEVQVELITQHNATSSIYTEVAVGPQGALQHLGVMTHSVKAELARYAALGIEPVQWGSTGNGIHFAYVASDRVTGGHPGGMIELIEHGPAIDGFFAIVKKAALGWDGSKPLRRMT